MKLEGRELEGGQGIPNRILRNYCICIIYNIYNTDVIESNICM